MTSNTDDDNIEIIAGNAPLGADEEDDGKSLTDLVELAFADRRQSRVGCSDDLDVVVFRAHGWSAPPRHS